MWTAVSGTREENICNVNIGLGSLLNSTSTQGQILISLPLRRWCCRVCYHKRPEDPPTIEPSEASSTRDASDFGTRKYCNVTSPQKMLLTALTTWSDNNTDSMSLRHWDISQLWKTSLTAPLLDLQEDSGAMITVSGEPQAQGHGTR